MGLYVEDEEVLDVIEIVTVETPQLGNRAYVVHDGQRALVVDPPRDIDRIERAAEEAGVEIDAVAETHVHNDYVSGGPALARTHRAEYVVAAAERIELDRAGVVDGDVFDVGGLEVEVVATPGHTAHHLAYLARTTAAGMPALFSGGSLLFGTVGRTDLAGHEHTDTLTRQQFRSAHRLSDRLPPETTLHPTHGFGSFCASTPAAAAVTGTLAEQLVGNVALSTNDEDAFVDLLRSSLGPYPAYYAHMSRLNREGYGLHAAGPPRLLGPSDVEAAIARGAWLVDLRGRSEFASGHLRGSVNFEYADSTAVYVGWVFPWGAEIILLANSEARLAAARRDLARIGIDHVAGGAMSVHAAEGQDLRAYPARRWEDLAAAYQSEGTGDGEPVVLDVRQRQEYDEGHLQRAISMPIQDVLDNVDRLPPATLWVHCRSGYRAGMAASLLHAAGRRVVLIDDHWARVASVGLAVTSGAPAAAAF